MYTWTVKITAAFPTHTLLRNNRTIKPSVTPVHDKHPLKRRSHTTSPQHNTIQIAHHRALLPSQHQRNNPLATDSNRTLRRGHASVIARCQIRAARYQRLHNRQVTEHDGVVQRRRLQVAPTADVDVGAVREELVDDGLVAGDGCEV